MNKSTKASLNPTAEDTGVEYLKAWGKGNVKTATQQERDKRSENAKEIANAYYDLVNDNFEEGWGRKFHFCRFQPGESIEAGLARHEHYMALMTEIKPGMKILDVGCGVGGPARSIASFTGCHVTGITINKVQVARAKLYSEQEGLADCVDFIEGDFMVCLLTLLLLYSED
jgi:sterol 24-C-methyltransferase